MLPSIWPGDIACVSRVDAYRPGDVVLFSRNGRLFVHRVVEMSGGRSGYAWGLDAGRGSSRRAERCAGAGGVDRAGRGAGWGGVGDDAGGDRRRRPPGVVVATCLGGRRKVAPAAPDNSLMHVRP